MTYLRVEGVLDRLGAVILDPLAHRLDEENTHGVRLGKCIQICEVRTADHQFDLGAEPGVQFRHGYFSHKVNIPISLSVVEKS